MLFWRGQHFAESEVAFHRNAAQLFSAVDALDRSKTTPAVVESHRTKPLSQKLRAHREGTEKRGKRSEGKKNFREREEQSAEET